MSLIQLSAMLVWVVPLPQRNIVLLSLVSILSGLVRTETRFFRTWEKLSSLLMTLESCRVLPFTILRFWVAKLPLLGVVRRALS